MRTQSGPRGHREIADGSVWVTAAFIMRLYDKSRAMQAADARRLCPGGRGQYSLRWSQITHNAHPHPLKSATLGESAAADRGARSRGTHLVVHGVERLLDVRGNGASEHRHAAPCSV